MHISTVQQIRLVSIAQMKPRSNLIGSHHLNWISKDASVPIWIQPDQKSPKEQMRHFVLDLLKSDWSHTKSESKFEICRSNNVGRTTQKKALYPAENTLVES